MDKCFMALNGILEFINRIGHQCLIGEALAAAVHTFVSAFLIFTGGLHARVIGVTILTASFNAGRYEFEILRRLRELLGVDSRTVSHTAERSGRRYVLQYYQRWCQNHRKKTEKAMEDNTTHLV